MGKAVICKDDKTSHGGQVMQGLPNATISGKQIATVGHQVKCPLCKGVYPIVEGKQNHTYTGQPVAVEGMKTACGATLIATQHQVTVD